MAVNVKDFSAAFFHISSLKNANTRNNTAASKQPNLFWFWEKLFIFYTVNLFYDMFLYHTLMFSKPVVFDSYNSSYIIYLRFDQS